MATTKRLLIAHGCMLTATTLYGINYRVAKSVMPEPLGPYGFVLMRVLGAGVVFFLLHRLFIKERVATKDYLRLFLCGFFGASLNILLFFKGLTLTTPFHASLVMVVAPIVILLIAWLGGVERLHPLRLLGIGLGLIGALILALSSQQSMGSSGENPTLWGDVLVLINGVSYGIYLSLARPLMKRYHPLTVMKWVFLFGTICSLGVGWTELFSFPIRTLSATQWGSIFFVIFGATSLTYLLNIYSLRHVPASAIGYYIYVQPFCVALLDAALGYGTPTPTLWVAAACIFAGATLTTRSKNKAKEKSPS